MVHILVPRGSQFICLGFVWIVAGNVSNFAIIVGIEKLCFVLRQSTSKTQHTTKSVVSPMSWYFVHVERLDILCLKLHNAYLDIHHSRKLEEKTLRVCVIYPKRGRKTLEQIKHWPIDPMNGHEKGKTGTNGKKTRWKHWAIGLGNRRTNEI